MSDDLPDVCFIADIARLLRCSTRTIERRLARGLSMPKEMRRIGHARRWQKADVLAWMHPQEHPQGRPHLSAHRRIA